MVILFDIIIPNAILAFALTIALYNLDSSKLKVKYFIPISFVNFIIFYLSAETSIFFAMPLSFIFMLIILFLNSKNIFYSIISVIFTFIIIAVGDICSGIIIMNLFKYNNSMLIKGNIHAYISLHLVLLIISYTLSLLIGKLLAKLKVQNYNFRQYFKDNLGVVVYTLSTLVIIYVNSMIYKFFFYESNKLLVILNLILIVVYFCMSVTVFYYTTKSVKRQVSYEYRLKEFEQLKEYTDMLENVSNDLKKFRHDYINILTSMSGYIEAKDIDGLEKYFSNEVLPESNKITNGNKNLSTLQKVKVLGLKGLLSSKIIKAQSININTLIDIPEDVNEIVADSIDFCRIMGILFDNAIEAAAGTEEKRIDFGIMQNDECILFIILNSCEVDMPPVHKIYEKGFSTKGQNRGLGLNIIKEIIDEKYPNILLNTSIENRRFRQELIVYKD